MVSNPRIGRPSFFLVFLKVFLWDYSRFYSSFRNPKPLITYTSRVQNHGEIRGGGGIGNGGVELIQIGIWAE